MSVSWYIAKRYLLAQRRSRFLSFITSITILGISLGTSALIVTLSILDGFEREIKDKVIGFSSHIQVQGYQNLPLSNSQHSIELLKEKIPDIKSISPYAAREGMIRSKDHVDGIFLKGVNPNISFSNPSMHITEGSFLRGDQAGMPEIVIGRKLANRLDVNLSDKLVVFAVPRGDPQHLQPRAKQFVLVGIYESGMAEYDDIYAYTQLSEAQKLFQMGNEISGMDILVHDASRAQAIAKQVEEVLPYPHYARTVFQLYRNLFSWINLQQRLSPLLLSLIILVATVNIIGTVLMFVLDKAHAIGILKSMGASSNLIQRIFTLQGLIIALIGIGLGNVLAYAVCFIQLHFKIFSLSSEIYYMNTVPILLKLENFALVTGIAFILCFLTTVLPSRAAAKMDPMTILRFG
ncbi:MAG TPA: ABC transporter permease [Bacteroidota bacterium]|nr:ABC transporter permease [Bacteroidota bacterium]